MAVDARYVAFNCLNPDCCKPIKVPRPAASGAYPVTCPHCGIKKVIKIVGLDELKARAAAAKQKAAAEQSAPAPEPQQQAAPDNSAAPAKVVKGDFIVDEDCVLTCPHCGFDKIALKPKKAGRKDFPCPVCHGKISLEVREPTHINEVSQVLENVRAKLVLLRRGWLNKDYPLQHGRNVIGRHDHDAMSDISLKGDPAISRRSAEIIVEHGKEGCTFRFKVLKATNPVLHNGIRLDEGNIVYLNFGDTITMGTTRLRFDKDSK